MSKNVNVTLTGIDSDLLWKIQQKLSEFRKAAGAARNTNQTDAIGWAIRHAPLPTRQTAEVAI